MKRRFLARFGSDADLFTAVAVARREGWALLDAFTPCPVHGLEEALGIRPTRLPWVTFLCGLTGAAFMMWFQHWTSAVDWRLNVGGRPWNSSLSFACVAFEVMVLFSGLGSVVALLVVSRLRPGKPVRVAPGTTDDVFGLLVEEAIEPLTPERIAAALGDCHLLDVVEQQPDGEEASR